MHVTFHALNTGPEISERFLAGTDLVIKTVPITHGHGAEAGGPKW